MRFPDRLFATLWSCRAIVWMASRLVPAGDRKTWQSEQNRRFWHWVHFLGESGEFTAHNRLLIARACWQLFPEACWTRFDRDRFYSGTRRLVGSPGILLIALVLAIAALVYGSGAISVARGFYSTAIPQPDRVVVVTLDGNGINGNFARTRSDTLLDLASVWGQAKYATGLSPFSWAPATVLLPSRDLPVAIARVGVNFFSTAGITPLLGRAFLPDDFKNCPECVLLSYGIWQSEFHSDAEIVGKPIVLNGSPRKVIGVLPKGLRLLSPSIGVWGLIDPTVLFTNFQRRVGAIGLLNSGADPGKLQRELSDLTESAGYVHPSSQIQVFTVTQIARRTIAGLLWFLALATGSALLVTVLRRSSRNLGPMPEGFAACLVWLTYFVVKCVLLLVCAALLAWSAFHWFVRLGPASGYASTVEYSIWLYLPVAILALAWSVRDQQRRCRACLGRLELPVEIGHAGSVLLNWSGTEMVCPRGHGVLYLPEEQESSLDAGRWSRLDDSWESLFREN